MTLHQDSLPELPSAGECSVERNIYSHELSILIGGCKQHLHTWQTFSYPKISTGIYLHEKNSTCYAKQIVDMLILKFQCPYLQMRLWQYTSTLKEAFAAT